MVHEMGWPESFAYVATCLVLLGAMWIVFHFVGQGNQSMFTKPSTNPDQVVKSRASPNLRPRSKRVE